MDSKIGFEISLIVSSQYVDDVRVHGSNGNGFGDMWWTDKLFYLVV